MSCIYSEFLYIDLVQVGTLSFSDRLLAGGTTNSVTDGVIAFQPPRVHSRQHEDVGIDVVIDSNNAFRIVKPVKPSDVLLQCSFP